MAETRIELSKEFSNEFLRIGMEKVALAQAADTLLRAASQQQLDIIRTEQALWKQVGEAYGLDLLTSRFRVESADGKSVLTDAPE